MRTYEQVFQAHPDWFARDAQGEPFRSGDLYTVCVNGPWTLECIPAILREIAERYRPDGFTGNSWSGLGQRQVCCCDRCRELFRRAASLAACGESHYPSTICSEPTNRAKVARERVMTVRTTASVPDDPIPRA